MKWFKSYPEYQDISSDWVDQVPYHWDFCPVRRIFRPINGATPDSKEEDYWGGDIPWATPEDLGLLEGNTLLTPKRYITREGYQACGTELVPKGSLLLSIRAPVGYVAIAGKPLCTNQGCRSLVPKKQVDTGYFYYQLSILSGLLNNLSGGSTFRELSSATLASIPLALPSLEEQRKIAQFLDYQTAKIDRLIQKQQRLIELLKDKWDALVMHTITSGLDHTVPRRSTGVEWLGEIPAHWEVKPLKYLAHFVNGYGFKPEDWNDEGTPIIRIENLNGSESFNKVLGKFEKKYEVKQGDLLFGWSGNRGTSFGPFIWWKEGVFYLNQHIFKIVGFKKNKKWLYWALVALTEYIEQEAHGIIGMVHITREKLGSIPVPVPPEAEQDEIQSFLDKETQKISKLIEKAELFISCAREHRTSFISEAVTGKIDVRDWDPPETAPEASKPAEALNG